MAGIGGSDLGGVGGVIETCEIDRKDSLGMGFENHMKALWLAVPKNRGAVFRSPLEKFNRFGTVRSPLRREFKDRAAQENVAPGRMAQDRGDSGIQRR
jgi:hypothetical protein